MWWSLSAALLIGAESDWAERHKKKKRTAQAIRLFLLMLMIFIFKNCTKNGLQ
jgi:hypothetical protein